MTRGYYVLKKGNKILEAAYLSGDAYLRGGYGKKNYPGFLRKQRNRISASANCRNDRL